MRKEYLTYTVEDFATNDDFIAWVKENDQAEMWQKLIATNSELGERIREARLLVKSLTHADSPIAGEIAEVWTRIAKSTQPEERSKPKKTIRLWTPWVMAAAAAAALLVLALPALRSYETLTTHQNQEITHTLPDNSQVWLDDESSLRVYHKAWDKERKVHLQGLAFFEVTKGQTFQVTTDQGSVTVLGTSFSVEARPSSFRVVCRSGKVKVTSDGGEKILQAGDNTYLKDGRLTASGSNSNQLLEWMNGIYRFSEVPLSDVMEELERQYGVDVEMSSGLAKRSFSGFFEVGDLDRALQSICWHMNLTWVISGNTIIIEEPSSI